MKSYQIKVVTICILPQMHIDILIVLYLLSLLVYLIDHSGYAITQATNLKGTTFVDQVISDI